MNQNGTYIALDYETLGWILKRERSREETRGWLDANKINQLTETDEKTPPFNFCCDDKLAYKDVVN